MAWNYRVVKKKLVNDEETFDVCEVYYSEEGVPNSWAWNVNVLSADSMEDLEKVLERIQEAMKKPILEVVGDDEGLRELPGKAEVDQ